MDAKAKAIEALEKAGFVYSRQTLNGVTTILIYSRDPVLDGYSDDTALVYEDDGVVCLEVYLKPEDVVSFLSTPPSPLR